MARKRRFRPGSFETLEPREVMSAAGRIAPVVIRPLDQSGRRADATATAIALVNQSFSTFTRDYLQAQGAFLATPRSGDDRQIFQMFIRQRTNLLATELTRTLARVPGSLQTLSGSARNQTGSRVVLQAFLRARIDGPGRNSLLGNLGNNRFVMLASQANNQSATLVTYQALTAIETARTNTLNAVTFLVNKTFHN